MCRDIIDNGTDTRGQAVRPHWADGEAAYTIKQFVPGGYASKDSDKERDRRDSLDLAEEVEQYPRAALTHLG